MTAAGRTGRDRARRGRSRGVGLRARLVAFFVGITVVPLTAAVVSLQLEVDRLVAARAQEELAALRAAAVALIDSERARAGDLADDLADRVAVALADGALAHDDLAGEPAAQWLETALAGAIPGRADVAGILDANGRVAALQLREPEVTTALDVEARVREAVDAPQTEHGLFEVRELRAVGEAGQQAVGWVVTGVWTDARLIQRVGVAGGAAFLADGRVVAVIGVPAALVPVWGPSAPGAVTTATLGDDPVTVSVAPLADDAADLALWIPRRPRANTLAVGALILVPSVLLAGLLGWLLAMAVIAPVRRAADAARAIATGDLSRTLEPTGGPELADLATALNTMRAELANRLEDLSRSRDRLRGSLDRLGLALSSSLDLNRTLAVVVETAKETLEADRALLLLFTPERDALYCKVARGMPPPPTIDAGAGLVGHVALGARAVLLPSHDRLELPRHVGGEPSGASQLAVPLLGRGRVLGVMTLLRDDPDLPFTESDLDTVRSFAAQASVAIENVLLHQEARRLSVTDPLTGLWNFRYFQLQADRELESAARFDRPLALLIVDVDHFKAVNDAHGHQVGDAVLAEVARRIRDATRAPDVVARYGGEEFVVLLPGTGLDGGMASAERIRSAVGEQPVDVRGAPVPLQGDEARVGPTELRVTCSAGVAAFPEHGRTAAALLRCADSAMYAAKRQGRNRVVGAAAGGEDLDVGEAGRDVSG